MLGVYCNDANTFTFVYFSFYFLQIYLHVLRLNNRAAAFELYTHPQTIVYAQARRLSSVCIVFVRQFPFCHKLSDTYTELPKTCLVNERFGPGRLVVSLYVHVFSKYKVRVSKELV